MTKTITKLAIALSIATFTSTKIVAQSTITFDTFTLAADTFYQDVTGADFSVGGATFKYDWDQTYSYWSEGTAYTNKKDTVFTASATFPYYANLYGCIPGAALSGTKYATMKSNAVVTFSNNTTAISGFYVTNTTYAWKSIKKGDMFARKFGDTTGTGSGTSIPQGQYPDWFKLIVRGYRGGVMTTDSVEYYLADYRAAGTSGDYVIKNWQYVNCTALGQVDSVKFILKSSDTGGFGMNTPGYFSIDDLTTQTTVGINELALVSNTSLYPNPSKENIFVKFHSKSATDLDINVSDVTGKNVYSSKIQSQVGENSVSLETLNLEAGIYFIELYDGMTSEKLKFIKL